MLDLFILNFRLKDENDTWERLLNLPTMKVHEQVPQIETKNDEELVLDQKLQEDLKILALKESETFIQNLIWQVR